MLTAIQAETEGLDARIKVVRTGIQRWRESFEREVVAMLSQLASENARNEAYSLSYELWEDLKADAEMVWEKFSNWASNKGQELKNLPGFIITKPGLLWLLRWVVSVGILVAFFGFRRRLGMVVSFLVRKISRISAMKKHIGTLVRLAGLFHSLLPTLIFLLVGYLAFALIGFDHPEILFIEVAFRWVILYLLGRQVILGLTRQVSRGRPALVSASTATSVLLKNTYGRLGGILAMVAIVDEWSRSWLGAGSLSTIVRWIAWIWLFGWALWAMFVWRLTLGQTVIRKTTEGNLFFRMGQMIVKRRTGTVLVPIAIGYLFVIQIIKAVSRLLAAGGVFSWLRAKALRKMTRREVEKEQIKEVISLPEEYLKEFPLYPIQGEEEAILLPRDDLVGKTVAQVDDWRGTSKEGSIVLVGEKGSGKTTLLTLLQRRLSSLPVARHVLSKKIVNEKTLLAELGALFDLSDPPNMGVLVSHLNKGEERVVLLDEGHNLFLRMVDGYQAYDAFIRLVTFTSERIFWIVVFNSFSWNFINHSQRKVHYFRKLIKVPAWSTEELQDLIARRNKRTGVSIQFDEVLLGEGRSSSGDIELLESAEGYFRLLKDASGVNPRVATYLWLKSLRPISKEKLLVGLFREETEEELSKLDHELLFSLAAIYLSVDELRRVLNVSQDFAVFAVRYLTEYGYTEPKHTDPKRVALAPKYYQQVLKVLRDKHLLFEEG